MKWHELLRIVLKEPVFTSAMLQAGQVSRERLRLQLSRWTEAGKILQLRRGVFVLAHPYRSIEPHPFLLANTLRKNSYVSLQSALAYHSLIPEYVPVITSITTSRPEELPTDLGVFAFRHIKMGYFFGYLRTEVAPGQKAFLATPEKALLDLVYGTRGGERTESLRELRLQNTDTIDLIRLRRIAERYAKPKISRAANRIVALIEEELNVT